MKIITLEEHFLDTDVARASAAASKALSPNFAASYHPARGFPYSPSGDVLRDLGENRLADMDANQISMQVLSCLSVQQLPAEVALDLTKKVNDTLAATVANHPDRFAAFTALPTAVPNDAADELARGVTELGFVGTMIFGRTEDEFLDAERFDPILARAADLKVPIYLHPAVSPRVVSDANYAGLDPLVSARFETSAWGWHQETAVHFLHLVLSGTLDRYPELQFILGHWGEMIPFYLDRLDEALPRTVTKTRPVHRRVREAERLHHSERNVEPSAAAVLRTNGGHRPADVFGRLSLCWKRGRRRIPGNGRPATAGQGRHRPRHRRTAPRPMTTTAVTPRYCRSPGARTLTDGSDPKELHR